MRMRDDERGITAQSLGSCDSFDWAARRRGLQRGSMKHTKRMFCTWVSVERVHALPRFQHMLGSKMVR
jgi:hypothetical protein